MSSSKNPVIRNIPNSITCINILSGTIAIICASRGDALLFGAPAWVWASVFIGVAALADFCDGLAARLLGAYSDMGKELDSLCDVVSFGVAPAILLHNSAVWAGAPWWVAWAPLLIPVGGALRLARFNTDPAQSTTFTGLPIPANAIFWVGFVFLYHELGGINNGLTLVCTVGMAWLMVSPLRMYSLKFHGLGLRANAQRWMLLMAAALFIFTSGVAGLLWTVLYYVASSVFVGRTPCNS